MKNIYKFILAGSVIFGLGACEDEVLVDKKDDTKVNELLTQIAAADEQYATLSTENNTLIVSNEELEKLLAQLEEERESLTNPDSEPKEVHYTITVLSSANSSLSGTGRVQGFQNATVVVEQNGLVLSPSSSANGMYLFTGLQQGYVYVRVSAPEHTSVELRSYIYIEDGEDVAGAESYNAQTQVVIYPNAGSKAGLYKGKALANTTVLNDTLNRKYGSSAAIFGTKANSFIAAPQYEFYDYTYYWDAPSSYNMYGSSVTGTNYVATYENALAGHKIYAYPYVDEFANNDYYSYNGYIYEVIYKGLVTSTTIAADGSYSLPVVSSAQYDDWESSLVNEISIVTDAYMAPHTRFTSYGGNYYGQTNESGSQEVDLKYYNNGNSAANVYNGTGTTIISIPSATAATINRRVITEDWWYFPSTNLYTDNIPLAGETRTMNLYFQPRYRD